VRHLNAVIVTAKAPKRMPPRKLARLESIPPAKVVTVQKPRRWKALRVPVDDPKADARVEAFFKRMIQPQTR
jgi:hypothetical protein